MAGQSKRGLWEKKRENLERAKQGWKAGLAQLSHFPLVLYLEPTSVCNLFCPMCPVAMGLKEYQYSEKFLDLNLVDALEEPLQYALRCFLSGGGEPFLHPYFLTLLELVKSYEPEIIFNTNGTLITRENALHLVKLAITTISFSIDAISPEKYRAIRKGAELAQVVEGILLIQEEKRKLGLEKPYLNMQFTLMRENREELEGLVQFAYALGLNHLVVEPLSPVFNFDPVYQDFFKDHYVPGDPELIKILTKLKRQAQGRLFFSSHYLNPPGFPERCIQPWINFGLRTNGRVFLCCGTGENFGFLKPSNQTGKMGGAWSGGFEERGRKGSETRNQKSEAESEVQEGDLDFWKIWNGSGYQEFRLGIAEGRYPKVCSLCLSEARSPWFNYDLLEQ